jgi:hypothetical protein
MKAVERTMAKFMSEAAICRGPPRPRLESMVGDLWCGRLIKLESELELGDAWTRARVGWRFHENWTWWLSGVHGPLVGGGQLRNPSTCISNVACSMWLEIWLTSCGLWSVPHFTSCIFFRVVGEGHSASHKKVMS